MLETLIAFDFYVSLVCTPNFITWSVMLAYVNDACFEIYYTLA